MDTPTRTRRAAVRALLVLAGAVLVAGAGCGGGPMFSGAGLGPQDRNLTLLLRDGYTGPEGVATAERIKAQVTEIGLTDVFIVKGGEMVSLCAGHFSRLDEPQAKEMLAKARAITDVNGEHPFLHVKIMPLPESVPENLWPLTEAKGYFTFHVASWGTTGRMAKAQAYAAQLRQQGYEAYVYHGPRLSMVTIGAFGMDVFENPAQYGIPNVRPKIISPVVLELIKRFPRMRIEGEEATGAKGEIPTILVEVPGHRPPTVGRPTTKAMYRVAVILTDTKTGLADGRLTAGGGAESKDEIAVLVTALVMQTLKGAPAGRVVRVGVAGVQPMDAYTSQEKADATALQAMLTILKKADAGAALDPAEEVGLKNMLVALRGSGIKITVVGPEETRRLLQAAGRTVEDVLLDPASIKGLTGLDFVLTGSVTSFER